MKKSHLYLALLALTALLMFFAACGEGTPVNMDNSDEWKKIRLNDSILEVEDYIRYCFDDPKSKEGCPDISKPAGRSSSSEGGDPSQPGGGYGSSSSIEANSELTCTELAQTGAASIAITRPVVKCNGDNVTPTFSNAPDWLDPEEGTYNVSATANCGGNVTVRCGTIEVGPPPTATELNCTNLSPTGVAGTAITKPTVTCGTNVITNPTFTGAPTPSWENPNEGSYTVKASPTGECKEAADCGTIKVSPKLNCAALTTTSVIAGTPVTPPAVTCGTTAVPATDFSWSATPYQPEWSNPVAENYTNIKAMATAGDCKNQTATCSGTLTVNKKLTCASVTQSILTGAIPTLPKVTCGSTDVTSGITWAPTEITSAIATAKTITGVKATASCGGSSQTADCAGTITVDAVSYTLSCANVSGTSTAGTAITAPTVTCKGSNSSSSTVTTGLTWTGAPTWSNPTAGVYNNVKVSTTSGNCSTAAAATCSGTITVNAATTYTLACGPISPATVTVGTAVTQPTVKCNGSNGTSSTSTTVSSNLTWTRAPTWSSPTEGTYNVSVKATGTSNCKDMSADCGTLTVTPSSSSAAVTLTCEFPSWPPPATGTSVNAQTQRSYLKCSNTNAAPTTGTPTWEGSPRAPISSGVWAAAGNYTGITVTANCGTGATSVKGTCGDLRITPTQTTTCAATSLISFPPSSFPSGLNPYDACFKATTADCHQTACNGGVCDCNNKCYVCKVQSEQVGLTCDNIWVWQNLKPGGFDWFEQVTCPSTTPSSSSSAASSSSTGGSTGGCAYQSSWCNGKYTTSSTVPTSVNKTGESCFFVANITSSTQNDKDKFTVNGETCGNTSSCQAIAKKDGGYYIYVKPNYSLEGGSAWSFTTGSPNCQ